MSLKTKLKINEIFKSVQGESTLIGQPTIFIRLQGCNLRCPWCDTKYSWPGDKGKMMTVFDIMKECEEVGFTGFVCITGGEPLLQREGVRELTDALCTEGQIISVETNGGVAIGGFRGVHKMIMDWKGPSAFKTHDEWAVYNKMVLSNINELRARQFDDRIHDEIKFLVADRKDYEFVRDGIGYLYKTLGNKTKMNVYCPTILVSPVIPRGQKPVIIRKLAEWMIADSNLYFMMALRPRYQLQIHKYIWSDVKRGV